MQMSREEMIAKLGNEFGLDVRKLNSEVDFYNTKYSEYGNEIYQKMSTRVAHWLNRHYNHNWFQERTDRCLDQLITMDNPLLVDVGFSIPYLHTDARFSHRSDIRSLLIDKEPNVRAFYETICKFFPSERQLEDCILIADVDDGEDRDRIMHCVKSMIDGIDSILICASEVIEHLGDDDNFWSLARRISELKPGKTTLFITLPIGNKIPSHNICFPQENDAKNELRKRMNIKYDELLEPPTGSIVTPCHVGCVCAIGSVKTESAGYQQGATTKRKDHPLEESVPMRVDLSRKAT